MKRIVVTAICLVGFAGCMDNKQPASSGSGAMPTSGTTSTNPDNTGVNVRDRDSSAKTAFDQKESKADIDVTAGIRKRIVGTEMSTDAKNIKIITENGRVTLRGPVKNVDEKNQIDKIAAQVAGEGKVDNQLDIANSR